jgi:hypothetical protein
MKGVDFSACAFFIASLATSTAQADPYVSVDAGFAHRTGAYRWANPGSPISGSTDPSPVAFDAHANGNGAAVDLAAGWTIHRAVSVAAEGGVAYTGERSGGSDWAGVSELLALRLGTRLENRCRYPLFLRVASGVEWIGLGTGSLTIAPPESSLASESMRGVYGALTLGVRMTRLGLFARGEVTRANSEHATFTPLGLVIGADATWF